VKQPRNIRRSFYLSASRVPGCPESERLRSGHASVNTKHFRLVVEIAYTQGSSSAALVCAVNAHAVKVHAGRA
jgi:hypothetical protein